MRVLNLDSPLPEPNKVSSNSNGPTCNLKKKKGKKKNHIDFCPTTKPKPIDSDVWIKLVVFVLQGYKIYIAELQT